LLFIYQYRRKWIVVNENHEVIIMTRNKRIAEGYARNSEYAMQYSQFKLD